MKIVTITQWYILFLLSVPFLCASIIPNLDYTELVFTASVYQQIDCRNSIITYLIDSTDTKYLVKQIKFDDKPGRLAKLVCEMVALEIGHSINIKLNIISIIPTGTPFIGKYLYSPATIHKCVPGIGVGTYQKIHGSIGFPKLTLKQKLSNGLSQVLISQIARHSDFPPLAALDTFTGNGDRGQNNFFYDAATDSFFGIDMASAFSLDLCKPSVAYIETVLKNSEFTLNKQEYLALECYCKTVQQLVALYTPESICAMIDDYAHKAGFYIDDFFDKVVQTESLYYLEKCKARIHESYIHAFALVDLLHKVLELHILTTLSL